MGLRTCFRSIPKLGLAAGCLLSWGIYSPIQAAQEISVRNGAPPLTDRLARLINGSLLDADVPGVAVAVVTDGRFSWQGAFGVTNAKSRTPVTDQTVFEAASLSKPVFAYAVLQLVNQGLLSLDTPLVNYLDDPDTDDPRGRLITARHALSNTSGFPHWRPRYGPLEMAFNPGERFSYSGEGYAFLQRVVEHLTGKPLNTFMEELVFKPLMMTNSSYIWRGSYERTKATGHGIVGTPNVRREPPEADAASTLHTTAADYARFLQAIVSRQSISSGLFDDMVSPQVTLDEGCQICVTHEVRQPSTRLSWGLGWGLEMTDRDTTLWHWGDNIDMKSFAVVSPRDRSAMVVLTNGENGLTIMPTLVQEFMGRSHPSFEWLQVPEPTPPVRRLHRNLITRGEDALRDYSAGRQLLAEKERVSEANLVDLAQTLIKEERVTLAIAVFRLLASDFPLSVRHLSNLGGAYLLVGDSTRALATYEKILVIDPSNYTAKNTVSELKAAQRR